MKPGDVVWLYGIKGRVTEEDSHGRLKAEFWVWPEILQQTEEVRFCTNTYHSKDGYDCCN